MILFDARGFPLLGKSQKQIPHNFFRHKRWIVNQLISLLISWPITSDLITTIAISVWLQFPYSSSQITVQFTVSIAINDLTYTNNNNSYKHTHGLHLIASFEPRSLSYHIAFCIFWTSPPIWPFFRVLIKSSLFVIPMN